MTIEAFKIVAKLTHKRYGISKTEAGFEYFQKIIIRNKIFAHKNKISKNTINSKNIKCGGLKKTQATKNPRGHGSQRV